MEMIWTGATVFDSKKNTKLIAPKLDPDFEPTLPAPMHGYDIIIPTDAPRTHGAPNPIGRALGRGF